MPFQRIRRAAFAASALGLVVGAAAGVVAQRANSAQAEYYRMNVVTVKRGMMADFTKFQGGEVVPALKKGGAAGRLVWTSGEFGDANVFVSFLPVKDLSQYDSPSAFQIGAGQQAAAMWAKDATMTESGLAMLVRTRPDLAYVPDPKAPPAPLALVSEVEINTGRRADFEAVLKKEVLPLMQQAKVRSYSVLEVMIGGNVGTYYTSVAYENYAGLAKGHPFDVVLGPGGSAKIEAKFAGIIKNVKRSVARHSPEMSFVSPAGTSN